MLKIVAVTNFGTLPEITRGFYKSAKNADTSSFLNLFSEDFFKVTNRKNFIKMFQETNNNYGNVLEDSLTHWETLVIEGNNPKSEYLLIYEVKRENINSQEFFTLRKEKDGIKIFEYRVNIDTLNIKK